MSQMLHNTQLLVKDPVAYKHNDGDYGQAIGLRMSRPQKSNANQTVRVHYIPEWASHRGLSQSDIVRGIGADKATVSRWFKGTIPSEMWFGPLVELLQLDDAKDLFRHPDDDWLSHFFRDRTEEERERIRRTLEAAFPRKTA